MKLRNLLAALFAGLMLVGVACQPENGDDPLLNGDPGVDEAPPADDPLAPTPDDPMDEETPTPAG